MPFRIRDQSYERDVVLAKPYPHSTYRVSSPGGAKTATKSIMGRFEPQVPDEADGIIKQTRSRDDARHDRRTPYCIRLQPRPGGTGGVARGCHCSRPSGPASLILGLAASDAAGRAAAGWLRD